MFNAYGLLISLSILVCTLLVASLEKKKDEDTLWGLVFWAIVSGVIGARIYHVIDYSDIYFNDPVKILQIWNGGLGIWGAIIGGAVGSSIYLRKRKENILYWLDLISVVLPLGQSIGRWGNLFNQEIFGKPTNLPWGIHIEPNRIPMEYLNSVKFHPLFLYESILNLLLFIFLYVLYKKQKSKLGNGIFLSLYLSGYSIIRFFMEFLKVDPWKISFSNNVSLNVSQCISILVLVISMIFIKSKFRKGKQ